MPRSPAGTHPAGLQFEGDVVSTQLLIEIQKDGVGERQSYRRTVERIAAEVPILNGGSSNWGFLTARVKGIRLFVGLEQPGARSRFSLLGASQQCT